MMISRSNQPEELKRVAVIGDSGLLGEYVVKAFKRRGAHVIGVSRRPRGIANDNLPFDARNGSLVEIGELNAQVIVNCAAIASHAKCEADYDLAYSINSVFPERLARLSSDLGSRFIHVSTDAVFAGSPGAPFTEEDEKAPLDSYGKTKALAEDMILESNPSAIVLRTNFFGIPGLGRNSVYWDFLMRLRQGEPLVAYHDYEVSSLFAGHLAESIVDLCFARFSGLLHVASRDGMTKLEFAETIARLHLLPRERIEPESVSGPRGLPNRGSALTLDVSRVQATLRRVMPSTEEGIRAAINQELENSVEGLHTSGGS